MNGQQCVFYYSREKGGVLAESLGSLVHPHLFTSALLMQSAEQKLSQLLLKVAQLWQNILAVNLKLTQLVVGFFIWDWWGLPLFSIRKLT